MYRELSSTTRTLTGQYEAAFQLTKFAHNLNTLNSIHLAFTMWKEAIDNLEKVVITLEAIEKR